MTYPPLILWALSPPATPPPSAAMAPSLSSGVVNRSCLRNMGMVAAKNSATSILVSLVALALMNRAARPVCLISSPDTPAFFISLNQSSPPMASSFCPFGRAPMIMAFMAFEANPTGPIGDPKLILDLTMSLSSSMVFPPTIMRLSPGVNLRCLLAPSPRARALADFLSMGVSMSPTKWASFSMSLSLMPSTIWPFTAEVSGMKGLAGVSGPSTTSTSPAASALAMSDPPREAAILLAKALACSGVLNAIALGPSLRPPSASNIMGASN